MTTSKVKAYGSTGSFFSNLSPMEIERAEPKADEVQIEILYCGVCHSDLHQVKNDWKNTIYPCVPGHEIIGRVTQAGSSVTKFNVGDTVGVGCLIDSCGECRGCTEGLEQYCEGPVGATATYNGYMQPSDGTDFNTFGGYSAQIVVKESFVLRIPDALDPSTAAPILCAGITTYSPLKYWEVGEGSSVAIVGLGGLGHMGVKLAKAMGANVTVVTTSDEKRADATRFGADYFILSTDKDGMKAAELSFDLVLITIPESFDVNDYVKTVKRDGALVTVGLLGEYKASVNNMEVAMHRRTVAGSLIGGIEETQDVLDFCAEHGIAPDVQSIPIHDINKAFSVMNDKEVHYRYVIDMDSLKHEPPNQ